MASISDAVTTSARALYSIAKRDLQARHAQSPIGIFSMIVEPMVVIAMLSLILSQVRMREPGMGDYLILFLMTGIIPLMVFTKGYNGALMGFGRLKKTLLLPQLSPIDLLAGAVLANLAAMAALFFVISFVFHFLLGTEEPANPLLCMVPFLCNALIGMGFVSVVMVAGTWFPFLRIVVGLVITPLPLASGMFYTASSLPSSVQNVLYYNPFMHSTELTRSLYFPNWDSNFFDPYYYFLWTAGAVVVGLAVERLFRYRLLHDAL